MASASRIFWNRCWAGVVTAIDHVLCVKLQTEGVVNPMLERGAGGRIVKTVSSITAVVREDHTDEAISAQCYL